MIDLEINIELYDKSYTDSIIQIFKKYSFDKPIYFIEYSNNMLIQFNTNYHQWELQKDIELLFENYEFVETTKAQQSNIILKIQRVQSPLSTTNWGQPINTDFIKNTVYLVKKGDDIAFDIPKTKFQVLFGDTLKEYKVHLAVSTEHDTGKSLYFLLKEPFVTPEQSTPLIQRGFNNVFEAFWAGVDIISPNIEQDFETFQKEQKTLKRKQRKSN